MNSHGPGRTRPHGRNMNMHGLRSGVAVGVALGGVLASTWALADDVTLTVSRWAGPQADAQQKLLDEYSKASGVTVKLDAIDYGQLKQKQTLNMSTKTGEYDLIYVPEAWFDEYS